MSAARRVIAAALLVTVPGLLLDRLLALAGTGAPTRDALVVLAVVGGALAAALCCPQVPGARLVLVLAAALVALEPVGDGLVLPVMAAALSLLVVWLAQPAAVPVAHR